jgi:hypothetical protein
MFENLRLLCSTLPGLVSEVVILCVGLIVVQTAEAFVHASN